MKIFSYIGFSGIILFVLSSVLMLFMELFNTYQNVLMPIGRVCIFSVVCLICVWLIGWLFKIFNE